MEDFTGVVKVKTRKKIMVEMCVYHYMRWIFLLLINLQIINQSIDISSYLANERDIKLESGE